MGGTAPALTPLGPDATVREVLAACVQEGEPLCLVDSPPGAGKTRLIEQIVALAVGHGKQRVYCVTPGADQAVDLVRRLVSHYVLPRVELLWSASRGQPAGVAGRAVITDDPAALAGGPGVVVSTLDKLAVHRDVLGSDAYELLLCDESYQITFANFVTIADVSQRAVLVGDPGQLAPTVKADTIRFEGTRFRVHHPAPRELLRMHPGARIFRLPASRRLLPDTVEMLQPSFYPHLPFVSSADPAHRVLRVPVAGIEGAIDKAIDRLASGSSIVAIVLPGAPPRLDDRDDELAEVMAGVAERLLVRKAEWRGQRALGPGDIGVIDEHVRSGGAVRQCLRDRGLEAVRADTPEVWQGLEVPIAVVKHPLSVPHTPTAFDLDPGRFCVMLSRHLLGCVIVTRESVVESIHGYTHDCGDTPWGANDKAWDGYRAHQRLWDELKRRGRLIAA